MIEDDPIYFLALVALDRKTLLEVGRANRARKCVAKFATVGITDG